MYLFVHFVLVFAWWTSTGKELTSLSDCAVICLYSFPVWHLGKDEEFDFIGS